MYIAVALHRTNRAYLVFSVPTYIVVDLVWLRTFFLRFKQSKQAFDFGTPTMLGNHCPISVVTFRSCSAALLPVGVLASEVEFFTKREVCHANVNLSLL